jgi:hypothetical protein
MTIEVRTLFAFQLDKEREPTYILYLVRLLQQAQIRPSQNLRRLRAGLVRFVGIRRWELETRRLSCQGSLV